MAIFRHKSDDWISIFVSLARMTFGVTITSLDRASSPLNSLRIYMPGEEGSYRYPMRAWANFVHVQVLPGASASQQNKLLTGTLLGPCQVLEQIQRGGMAEVYKGRHPRLVRTVAINILPARLSSNASDGQGVFAQRFERGARAVATLRHPNFVQIFDFGDIEGTYYMVMEYIRGQALSRLIRQNAPSPRPAS